MESESPSATVIKCCSQVITLAFFVWTTSALTWITQDTGDTCSIFHLLETYVIAAFLLFAISIFWSPCIFPTWGFLLIMGFVIQDIRQDGHVTIESCQHLLAFVTLHWLILFIGCMLFIGFWVWSKLLFWWIISSSDHIQSEDL
ncbi:MAG: hypothetical protein K0U52_07195 [Gammaproteobacteria bacterium]|nr:hypothetical protein [Gammaproteobacteria bacterium]